MYLETFEYIWEKCIKKTIDYYISNMPQDIKQKYNIERVIPSDDELKDFLFFEYIKARKYYKDFFFNAGEHSENLMDIHKVCSCICLTLIENPVFVFSRSDDCKDSLPLSVVLLNCKIAYMSTLRWLYMNLTFRFSNNEDQKYEKLYNNKSFLFPETNENHENYLLGQILTLCLQYNLNLKFNPLNFADTMFWIDYYNVNCI